MKKTAQNTESGKSSSMQIGETDILRSPDSKSLLALNQSADKIYNKESVLVNFKTLSRDTKEDGHRFTVELKQFPKITQQHYEKDQEQIQFIN